MGKQFIFERRSERRALNLVATCRKPTGFHSEVIVSNLTPEGCCIATGGILLDKGQHITLRPIGLETIGGIVRWVNSDEAGVEFDRPLYAPIVEHLVAKHGSMWTMGMTP